MQTTKDERKLDAWCAEFVLGLKRVTALNRFTDGTFITNTDAEVLIHSRNSTTWKPTTDPAAAFEVLKRCAEKCSVKIAQITPGNKWDVYDDEDHCRYAIAPTLELAICRFALKLFDKKTTD